MSSVRDTSHTRHNTTWVASPSNEIHAPQTACLWLRGPCGEESMLTNDEASEAAGWVVRTLLLPLLEAGWQGEGLSILGEEGPKVSDPEDRPGFSPKVRRVQGQGAEANTLTMAAQRGWKA